MSQLLMPQIAARMFDTPLMIEPRKMAAILSGLGGRIVDGGASLDGVPSVMHVAFEGGRPSAGVIGDGLDRRLNANGNRGYDMVGNVAVIPVEGTLVAKGAWVGQSSGETSYQGIQTQVARVARDPMVKGVVFEVDSFGGQTQMLFQTADAIYALSQAKPTMAILTDFAYSAGYFLASASRQIVAPPLGGAGSIGAMILHADMSQALEQKGVKVTMVTSGAHKGAGHPAAALSPEAHARMQRTVDSARDAFAASVGRYRGARFTKSAALATEAAVYDGTEAVKAGLIDAVGSPSEAFAAFVKAINAA